MLMVLGIGACSTADPSGDGGGSTGPAGGDGLETGVGETSTTSNQPDPDAGSSDDGTAEADTASDGADTQSDGSDGGETTDEGTGGPRDGVLDCVALCDPYEACDKSVFLTCQANCLDIVPPLQAFDDACGAASAEYFECRFTMTCEDAVAWIDDALDPDPCAQHLDDYVDACVAVVPERCDAVCEAEVACLPPDPGNLLGCQFGCLLYEGYAVLIDDPACTTATDDVLSCIAEGECEDEQLVGCDATFETYVDACCPGLPTCDE